MLTDQEAEELADLSGYTVPLGVPVRFLCVRWDPYCWEFDCPVVLLEPLVRYSPCGESIEHHVENAAIDLCIDRDDGVATVRGPRAGTVKEFSWRDWDLATLRQVAEEVLQGAPRPRRLFDTPCDWLQVEASWKVFREEDGETTWDDVEPPPTGSPPER